MSDSAAALPARQQAGTTVRFGVRRMAFWLAVVTYLDRVCIATAAPFIIDELGLTLVEMGLVFSAFTFSQTGMLRYWLQC